MPGPAEPRWLTAQEQATWRSFLEAVHLINGRVEAQLQRDCALSHADYEILVRLSEQPGRTLRMSELAERALFSRSRLSHAVARLEANGLVRREPCPDDRRGLLAVLTDQGYAALAAAAPGHVETVRAALFDSLTADQAAQLAAILRAVLAAGRGAPGGAAEK